MKKTFELSFCLFRALVQHEKYIWAYFYFFVLWINMKKRFKLNGRIVAFSLLLITALLLLAISLAYCHCNLARHYPFALYCYHFCNLPYRENSRYEWTTLAGTLLHLFCLGWFLAFGTLILEPLYLSIRAYFSPFELVKNSKGFWVSFRRFHTPDRKLKRRSSSFFIFRT